MKYIKTYNESHIDDLKELFPNINYKINDYIIFNRDLYSFGDLIVKKDKPYQVVDIIEDDNNSSMVFIDENNNKSAMNYFDDRFKKISDEEAKFLLNVNKYNV